MPFVYKTLGLKVGGGGYRHPSAGPQKALSVTIQKQKVVAVRFLFATISAWQSHGGKKK